MKYLMSEKVLVELKKKYPKNEKFECGWGREFAPMERIFYGDGKAEENKEGLIHR